MKRWFVSQQGKLKGPFTLAQLKAMIAAGGLKPEDMLRPENGGSPTWASRVPGLFIPGEPEPEPAPAKPAPNVAVTAKPAAAPVAAVVAAQPVPSPALPIQPQTRPVAVVPAAAERSNFGVLIAAGAIVGVVLFCVFPVMGFGLAWVFSGKDKSPEKKTEPSLQLAMQKEKEVEKPKPKPPAMSPKVKEAVDRGAEHLKTRVLGAQPISRFGDQLLGNATGVRTGTQALAGLALLEAGVSPKDDAVQKIIDDIRRDARGVTHVYSLGAIVFFLNRYGEAGLLTPDDQKLQRSLALQLVSGQCENGCWTYHNPSLSLAQETDLLKQLGANTYRPAGGRDGRFGSSNSMTQFGLLALWGSRKHVPVRQPILRAAAHFHATQSIGGTWAYARPDMPNNFHDSNTCAGLLALAMEKTLREEKGQDSPNDPPANPKADGQCDQAFAHLGRVVGRTKNDPAKFGLERGNIIRSDAYGDYYFLWCLERVAVIYDLKEIAGKDWYNWGSGVILDSQLANGSWQDVHGDVPDTCFAILFLTRANLAKDLTESIRTRGGKAAIP